MNLVRETDFLVHDRPMDDFLTPEQVAQKLAVNLRTVYRWLHSGKLRGLKLADNLWRIETADYKSFLDEGRRAAQRESKKSD